MALLTSRDAPQPLGHIIQLIKGWVERLGEVWVEAQVVEIKRRNAPTQFLTLRDPNSEFSCSATTTARVLDMAGPLPEGSRVVARVKPRVFDRSTSLSIELLEVHVSGEGRLLAELEQRKRKLQAEGLFDPRHKQPLPFLPGTIGVIAGRGSDAERDVVVNVQRRWPGAQFKVAHSLVQGPHAAAGVIQALRSLDTDPTVDVIVIARGGGALEDLLPFSDEGLVRAVAEAGTPVVSAIGHEADSPILDLVADVRASTPTDAAKLVVPDAAQERALIAEGQQRLRIAITQMLTRSQRELDELRSRPVLLDPTSAFVGHLDRLELLRHQLHTAIERQLRSEQSDLQRLITGVRAMSPKHTLERGYAVLIAEHGTISSIHDVEVGTLIHAYVADGELGLDVASITERNAHE